MHTLVAMGVMAALYLCFVLVRPRRECAGSCGSCKTSCHEAPTPEELNDVTAS